MMVISLKKNHDKLYHKPNAMFFLICGGTYRIIMRSIKIKIVISQVRRLQRLEKPRYLF